jgi:hypothetical protein
VDAHAHLFESAVVTKAIALTSTAAATPAPSTLRELLAEMAFCHVKFSAGMN